MDEQILGEIWRPVKGTNKSYYISSFGRIYSTKNNKLLKTPIGKRGYRNCNMIINGKHKRYKTAGGYEWEYAG